MNADKRFRMKSGLQAEALFAQTIINYGWEWAKSSSNDDRYKHFDCFIKRPHRPQAEALKIEVKAKKRIRRSDTSFNNEWIWLELHGSYPSDKGWLLGGQADMIAFHTHNKFILIDRKALASWVLSPKTINWEHEVSLPGQARYKPYRPWQNHSDLLTLIHIKDVKPFIKEIIEIEDEVPQQRYLKAVKPSFLSEEEWKIVLKEIKDESKS